MAKRRSSGGMIDIFIGGSPMDADLVPPVYQSVGSNADLMTKGREYGDGHGELAEPVSASGLLEQGYETLDQRKPHEKERRGLTPPQRNWRKF